MYIDGVGPFGGASRSLYEAVAALSRSGINPHFVAVRGTALDIYSKVATDIVNTRGLTRFDNTEYSHYRGGRWLILLREIFHFPFTLVAMLKAFRRWRGKIDLIHVNEVTEIIPGLIAKWLFRVPIVVHVRSLQWNNTRSWRVRMLHRWLTRSVDAVIAIDETTRASLPASLAVNVIHNSFTTKPEQHSDAAILSSFDTYRPDSLKVGFVGNLHVSKGIFDLVDAARLLCDAGANVEFIVVGGHTRVGGGIKGWLLRLAGLEQDVYGELLERITEHKLESTFHLLGPTHNIQCVYERLDVIAFPSHFDAPGRPVFEAAFFCVPCVACVSDPKPDTLVHGETGLTVPARDPTALAQAIHHFESNRSEVARMGKYAHQLAINNFEPEANARRIKNIYSRVLKYLPVSGVDPAR